ncbi:piggyBac transposable element-derived protein 4-like [Brienomyrus brachyistius]|uniref:piggyBac transposable element-derived protein 4-like n=1 Tax=Brienomyrus brachyistius TaxID=42636 RepID=UPI0020B3EAD3|nr:piggyBac transposable element-derived protein 4-like [Brienomyrus brachyistius]
MERHTENQMEGMESSTSEVDSIEVGNTSFESSEEDYSEDETFMSRNGEIKWSIKAPDRQRGRLSARYVLKRTPGPTRLCVSQASDILSTFKAFLPKSIEGTIVTMTNVEGRKRFSSNWTEFTPKEFDAFIGILILGGCFTSRGENLLNLWDLKTGRAIFSATMSRLRFSQLSSAIRFHNKGSRSERRDTDELAGMREVWDTWSANLPLMYNLGHDATIDELPVPFTGRCSFKQKTLHPSARCGLKLWVLCDAKTSYCWKVDVHTRKTPEEAKENSLTKRVVLDLSEGLRGQNITANNFVTSFDLVQELLKRHITMVGAVRTDRPELPFALVRTKGRRVYSSKFAFAQNTTLVSYTTKKKKNVVLMSTFHKSADVVDRLDRKPQIILDYNETKGGVDTMNQLVSLYSCKRRTSRWVTALFYKILDISAHNAQVVWKEINPSWKAEKKTRRRQFLQELGEALISPTIKELTRLRRGFHAAAIVRAHPPPPVEQSKRKRCGICPYTTDRKSGVVCCECGVTVCKAHYDVICKKCRK